ncbi:NAD(P)/FAD-dependent oxidoreductase [Methylohalobius crimeensis]|uniref:NAD(P)/FAD-dependent oxidoreductase n=1 Tax=Methylohalobius crimeensis TaxID=244365 RepID=UPI0003B6CCE4|nr:FAD-binding oxidoreductase [Methylohalobius crimeensis]
MDEHFHTVIIGGGCLGAACAIALRRSLGPGQVALVERKVLGAGLSSRHSAIVRAVNASVNAARMGKAAINCWKRLDAYWGVKIPYQEPGALWIAPADEQGQWSELERSMQRYGVGFQRLSPKEAEKLCQNAIRTDPESLYFYEPEALLLETGEVLTALQTALRGNDVQVFEHCPVVAFEQDDAQRIIKLHTRQGSFNCEQVVNAAGAWSAELFARCGIAIPVALEPVLAANFLAGGQEIPESLPIIADYVQNAYFRRWPGSQLHVHRPRSRNGRDVLAAFTRFAFMSEAADRVYEAGSQGASEEQLTAYREKIRFRFPQVGNPVSTYAYPSFFDITPDLRFILGKDSKVGNLIHCLGSGQALKYAPLFGEIVAALSTGEDPGFDLQEFSIDRFHNRPLRELCLSRNASTGL